MRVVSAIGHFFKHSAVVVADAFVKVFGSDAAHAFAIAAMEMLHSELGKIVETVVSELVAIQIPGGEKRTIALEKILLAAKEAGIEAKSSIVNLLIETAVQKLQGSFGAK